MLLLCLILIPIGLAVSLPSAEIMRRLGRRMGALDTEPIAGQVKMDRRSIPNTGGVAIYLGVVLPLLAGLGGAWFVGDAGPAWLDSAKEHLPGIRAETAGALVVLLGLTVVHAVGVVDDRRPIGPLIKLGLILGISFIVVWWTDTRLLTVLDSHVGGRWLSIVITVLWFGVVTNAMNFMDNMDGICAGCAATASACYLAAALLNEQWFVAATAALLLGSLLGFLILNFPPAKLFMGDGGSLVIGFLLAFLTVRTTYFGAVRPGGWYGVFMPLCVLAIPLYDFVTVTLVRITSGKSPFVGDLNHFSHRLARRGLSNRQTLGVVCALTAATGLAGVTLASLGPLMAVFIGLQVALILLAVAALEWGGRGRAP